MPKETIATLGLGLTLIAAVFGFGMRIGTLSEQITALRDAQNAQRGSITSLTEEVRAINQHFVAYSLYQQQLDSTRSNAPRRPTGRGFQP